VRQLHIISKHSVRSIKGIISHWLKKTPPHIPFDFSHCTYLVSDGTYLKHEHCIYAVTDYHTGLTINHTFGRRENYAMAYGVFTELKSQGCNPKAITIDGNTSVIRAIRAVWPHTLIQRCLYHILRQGTSWLRRFPQDEAAKELRLIVLTVVAIKDRKTQQIFLKRFFDWEKRFGEYVKAFDSRHKVWSDVQKTRILIMHALPDMFHFLRDPNIPPTSNSQEGLFSSAKILFRNHRGVGKQNRNNYFSWYFYFKNKKILNKKR
jgi:transposase-like protein